MRLAPVHGGMHSLSVSTYDFGTSSAPRKEGCGSTFGGTGGGKVDLLFDFGIGVGMPSAVFIFCQ